MLPWSPSDDELGSERGFFWGRSRLHRTPKRLATSFSKKVLNWLYSFSLIILMIVTFVVVFITPVDVVLQTWGANFTGVKLFIIIASISFFLLASLTFYFSRLIKTRVKVNQIPAKSVYLPLEKHDLPEDMRRHIETNLNRCLGDIKAKAGPLQNENESFNYPGMSPPLYIQQRNVELGLNFDYQGLPPNCVYDELINSIGLKLKVDGLLAGTVSYPTHYTFREIIFAIAEELQEHDAWTSELAHTTKSMVERYEKFRFSGDLIEQGELIRFFVEFEQLMLSFIKSKSALAPKNDPQFRSSLSVFAGSIGNSSRYDPQPYPEYFDPGFLDPFAYRGKGEQRRFSQASDGSVSRASTRSSRRTSHSVSRRLTRTGSVVKNQLDLWGTRRSAGRTYSDEE